MITWGIQGRGDNRSATIFCRSCRESLARNVPVEDARLETEKHAAHKCK